MSQYLSQKEGSNRDFRDQFASVQEYRATINQLPKVPRLIPSRTSENNPHRGLNRPPPHSQERREANSNRRATYSGRRPTMDHNRYNPGIL